MKETIYPQTTDERAKEADKLFLEFAVKKCSLTLSGEEILSQTQRLLREIADERSETSLEDTQKSEKDAKLPAPAADAADEGEASDGEYDVSGEAAEEPDQAALKKQGKKKQAFWGDLLFYGVLIALIVGVALLANGSAQGPRSFAGFTMQTVLTSSMESVYPKGSLVISRYTEPDALEIGDDITFMTNETTTVTHRIIGITEDYADTGQRAFQTQGVMNSSPDSQLVPAVNVVGKVVFHSLAAGKIAAFLESYWPLLLFFLVILAILTRVLKYIYRKDGKKENSEAKNQRLVQQAFLHEGKQKSKEKQA